MAKPARSSGKSDSSQTCAHRGCDCKVDEDSAVEQDGKLYCSQGCADGDGCTCNGCNCAKSEAPTKGRPRAAR